MKAGSFFLTILVAYTLFVENSFSAIEKFNPKLGRKLSEIGVTFFERKQYRKAWKLDSKNTVFQHKSASNTPEMTLGELQLQSYQRLISQLEIYQKSLLK